ncbi:hypothetical protein LguiA_024455 [Lonicera macranthoides]
MVHRPLLQVLVLFLGFSYLLSLAAVPTSRSLKSIKDEIAVQELHIQDGMEMNGDGEMFEGRMMAETTVDYPGTGANNHHDPKTPGIN